MGITSSGLVSGINIDAIISQIQETERKPVLQLQARQATSQKQISEVLSVSSKLSTLLAVATSVNNPANFNTRTASVTKTSAGVSVLSAAADSTAATGSYSITVKQLAQAHKKASQGVVDQNTTAVASGDGTFKFKVGSSGTEYSVSVSSSTTLQGLRDAINSAGGSANATIINDGTGSNPYRLVLTANTSGADNTITITNNNTTLDFTNNKIEAAYSFTTNSYAGTVSSNAGNNYTGTTNKTFLVEIVTGGAPGTAKYKYSIDGGISYLGHDGVAYDSSATGNDPGARIKAEAVLTDIDDEGIAHEGVQISFGAGTLSVGDKFSIDVFNPEFQAARDAVVNIDNTTITKSSNTITDAIQGLTLTLLQADTASAVTLNVSTDAAGLTEKVKNFVSAYNDVNKFLTEQFTFDPKVKKVGVLLADSSVRAVQILLKNIVSGSIPGLTTGKSNLSQVGITSDSKTGTLKVDDAKLSAAIAADPDGVKRLFLGIGTPTNSAITFVGLSNKTVAATYGIAVSVTPAKAVIGGASDVTMQNLSSTGLTNAEVLSFTFSGDYTATSPTTTSFAVTLTAGAKINEIVSALNSAFATQKVGLSASNDSGRLKLTSTNYGKDIRFTVVSNQAGSTQTGIGSVGRTAQGVDIAGTINGHSATGKGKVLTSNSGFGEDGLSISTETTSTGLFGTIAVSRGVGDRLAASLDTYTNPTSGIFIGKTNSLQATVDRISKDVAKIDDRIAKEGERLRAQLIRLESVLGKFQATSNFLTNQLSKLPTFSFSNQR
jgi:flagellar hook-associated protein 2